MKKQSKDLDFENDKPEVTTSTCYPNGKSKFFSTSRHA